MHYDLCLPWYWEYDIDFVQMIEHACHENGLTFWQVTPDNLLESINALYKGEISFRATLDRSQYDPRFEPIHRWSREHQILRARMEFPEQKYLIQATVIPRTIHGQPAWFRIFYAVGKTYPCWWHPLTHVFSVVTPQDEGRYELTSLRGITQRIASLCKLDWFSTEIALTLEQFVVVDYVNDGIDTRIQSKAVDGVPDEVIQGITSQLVKLVASK